MRKIGTMNFRTNAERFTNKTAYSILRLLSILLLCAQYAECSPVLTKLLFEGTVYDVNKTPLPAVEVACLSRSNQIIWTATTDAAGHFRSSIVDVEPGPYQVVAKYKNAKTSQALVISNHVDHVVRLSLSFSSKNEYLERGLNVHKNSASVRIFYATDRKADPVIPVTFGSKRSLDGSLSFGAIRVSIPRDHRMNSVERPSLWHLELVESKQKHLVITERQPEDEGEFYRDLSATIRKSDQRQAFVFIHGFDVSFDSAAYRTAQMAYDLGFDGAPIFYSWPSNGDVIDYIQDAANCEWTVQHLHNFLRELISKTGARSVHLIAHSMGNRALVAALHQMVLESHGKQIEHFHQIVLTAPDIDADSFTQVAAALEPLADRMTLYASSRDRALELSKRINGYPRAGDTGDSIVVIPGIDTVDVSRLDTNLLGHSYYAENRSVLSDMFVVVNQGLAPDKRFGIREVVQGPKSYWRFVP